MGGHDHCGKRYTDLVLHGRSVWASWDGRPQISEGFKISETRSMETFLMQGGSEKHGFDTKVDNEFLFLFVNLF